LGVFYEAILYLCSLMYFIYNILVITGEFVLKIGSLFHPKLKLFIEGRKETMSLLKRTLNKGDRPIWMHCASLGEFEQGRPIFEKLKEQYPSKKMLLTFFSPSGYEIRKKYKGADVVCYLPIDTKSRVNKFLDIVQPELAVFVKYEFWPNLLKGLQHRNIKTILVAGIFRKNQLFFSSFGGWMKKSLNAFSHFFVQDQNSEMLLKSINFGNVSIAGDTRFDRVYELTQQDNFLEFVAAFKNEMHLLVAGSTWNDDEAILVEYINNVAASNEKFILAPHNMHPKDIVDLRNSIHKKVVLFSEMKQKDLKEAQVMILDTIGILTKVYSEADVAYVGGGFTKTGVHNVLEPATYGIPIVIGPNFHKFIEAKELVELKACTFVDNSQKLSVILKEFYTSETKRKEIGTIALNYIYHKKGATEIILNYLKT